MAILTKDGQVIPTGNTVDTTGQSLGGGFYLPETKENIYGAFGNITLDEDENKVLAGVEYRQLIIPMLKKIQELSAKVEALENA